ncbi:hypothetical protein, partial [Bifidobacterium adolescentis]|uniref:hypothetical protein n=1 Tax=Bifidobacterium adolescentis TaxID=1680 RepID=UPI0021B3FE14
LMEWVAEGCAAIEAERFPSPLMEWVAEGCAAIEAERFPRSVCKSTSADEPVPSSFLFSNLSTLSAMRLTEHPKLSQSPCCEFGLRPTALSLSTLLSFETACLTRTHTVIGLEWSAQHL